MPKKEESREVHFRVGWRRNIAGAPAMVMDYMAPDLKSLLTSLKESENVTTSTAEYLLIHQVNDDGTITEHLSYDSKASGSVVQTLFTKEDKRHKHLSPSVRRRHKEAISDQAEVLSEVERILRHTRSDGNKEVAPEPKTKPRVKLKSRQSTRIGGFFYSAVEAGAVIREPSFTESAKYGVNDV